MLPGRSQQEGCDEGGAAVLQVHGHVGREGRGAVVPRGTWASSRAQFRQTGDPVRQERFSDPAVAFFPLAH
ncbi:hypothetical protein NDU88_004176 [Pleurodeles waltl]|uniref:Uncharacterized protein n=1 Tax=Pleurodeles waltl TaxID=8319 RepID=A0AAV7MSX3_PLEWA|nr:hypothetical protein NDU88_004176 [Pleurodeles waltl]